MNWGEPRWIIGAVILLGIALGFSFKRAERAKSLRWPRLVSLGGEEETRKTQVWFWVGMILTALALARPQWGVEEEQVAEESRDVLIAMDLSRSMLAEDVSPNRLERSKLLIQDLLTSLQGERVGLLLFAGTAFLQSPLSSDYEILRDFLPHLNTEYLPQGGTDYHRLLKEALVAFGEAEGTGDRFLIILSDGESTTEGWDEIAGKLAERKIRVIGLGVGTTGGSVIPEKRGGFVKDEKGAVVLSTLNSTTLEGLAKKTNGVYQDASQWVDLASLLAKTVEEGRKGKLTERKQLRHVERYQWFLIPGILALLVSLWREFPIQLSRKNAESMVRELQKMALIFLLFGSRSWGADPSENRASMPPSPLVKRVGELSQRTKVVSKEWGSLAEETLQEGKSGKLPKGAIYDALEAVDRGEREDAKAADWPRLRKELEALLKQQEKQDSESQDSEDSKDSKDSKDKKGKSKDSKGKNSKSQDSQESQDSQHDSSKPDPSNPEQGTDPQNQESKDQEKSKPDSKPKPIPQPKGNDEKQRVGGAKPKEQSDGGDFLQAEALRQMKQVKEGDNPATLFQILRGKSEPEPTKGKTW